MQVPPLRSMARLGLRDRLRQLLDPASEGQAFRP